MQRAVPALLRTTSPEPVPLHRLGGLLARWHCWRRGFRTERSYARTHGPADPEDELELLLMSSIEAEVDRLPVELQRAIAQVARAECLGVECATPGEQGDCRRAVALVEAGLIGQGLL
jgi:hypothetical protein